MGFWETLWEAKDYTPAGLVSKVPGSTNIVNGGGGAMSAISAAVNAAKGAAAEMTPEIPDPVAPPPLPTPSDPASGAPAKMEEARKAERRKGRSRAATMLTGGAGLADDPSVIARKTLLGA